MHVAHVIRTYREGMGYEENHLPFAQASLGLDVQLITSNLLSGSWQGVADGDIYTRSERVRSFRDKGVGIHYMEPGFHARSNSQITLKGLKAKLQEFQPDIIHIHGPIGALSLQSTLAARALNIPAVVDNHLCYFNLRPYGVIKRSYYRSFRSVLLPLLRSAVHRYLPLMPDSEAVLHNELGIPYAMMAQSTLGVDTGEFVYDESPRKRIRDELGIPRDARVLAFVGRITPVKGIDVLVSAWQSIAPEHNVYLVLIGPMTEDMQRDLVAQVGPNLRDFLKITGHVPNSQLPGYLSAVDIGVWPGDPGITVLQAMSCGLAIVSSEADYVAGLNACGNGIFFPRGNSRALATALGDILEDKSRLATMRSRSWQLAREVYDWGVVASRTIRIYSGVANGSPSSDERIWDRSSGFSG